MREYLKLIRWPNLFIILLSMSFLLYFVIIPALGISPATAGMGTIEFILLIVSTLLIAIGGYIVNDVFDINADSLNKPESNIIGNIISVKYAYRLYWITTITGVAAGTVLSYLINQVNFGLIFLFSAGLLWFYSQKYQCQPLVGNIVISLLSAISFGLVWLFEFYALSNNAMVFTGVQSEFPLVNRLITIYMGFAFFVSLLREIIKDIEDYKGDNRFGCITFTVKFGVSASKLLALIVAYITLVASFIVQYYFYNTGYLLLTGAFVAIAILILTIIIKLHKSTSKENFGRLSTLIKILMISGIMSMILFYFEK
jgi:4-hydroxybenzoate polyprenyltransferase